MNLEESPEGGQDDKASDSESSSSVRVSPGRPKYMKRKIKTETSDNASKAELDLMQSIGESLKNSNSEKEDKNKDDDELFCDLLSSHLKQLPDNIKIMVKMQINNMIYCTINYCK